MSANLTGTVYGSSVQSPRLLSGSGPLGPGGVSLDLPLHLSLSFHLFNLRFCGFLPLSLFEQASLIDDP